jgi:hypothetical protein
MDVWIIVGKRLAEHVLPAVVPWVRATSECEGGSAWTGDYIFENEWQSFRTKRDRSLELKSVFYECGKSERRKIAVKVVDIVGNDTMTIVDVSVGSNGKK